jgi:hypothetical protein
MPRPSFAQFTPEDMEGLIPYLRSLPPVKHKNPSRVPPGQPATGSIVALPAPSAWDAPRREGEKREMTLKMFESSQAKENRILRRGTIRERTPGIIC